MLFAYPAPENVVVGKATPVSANLGCSAKRSGVEKGEDLEGYFARKDDKGVDADEMAKLFCEEGKLGEAAHGEDAPKDELSPWVGGGREAGPDGTDGFAFADWEGIQGLCDRGGERWSPGDKKKSYLLELDVGALVCHALMTDAEFAGGGGAGVCHDLRGHRWGRGGRRGTASQTRGGENVALILGHGQRAGEPFHE